MFISQYIIYLIFLNSIINIIKYTVQYQQIQYKLGIIYFVSSHSILSIIEFISVKFSAQTYLVHCSALISLMHNITKFSATKFNLCIIKFNAQYQV